MTNLQAIDLLKGLEQSLDDYCELNDEGKTAFGMAITALELFGNSEQLPSAQPDIIACADCKYWICHDRRCGYWNHGVKPLDWCCHAERRTDEQVEVQTRQADSNGF